MQLHTFYVDALDRVLAWDLPEGAFSRALAAEAGRLAGLDSEHLEQDELS